MNNTLIIQFVKYSLKRSYDKVLDPYMKEEEFYLFVDSIHKIVTNTIIQKKKEVKTYIPIKFIISGCLALFSTIGFIVITAIKEEIYLYDLISWILLALVIGILFSMSIYVFLTPLKKYITLEEMIFRNINKKLEKVNIKYKNKLRFDIDREKQTLIITFINNNMQIIEQMVQEKKETENNGLLENPSLNHVQENFSKIEDKIDRSFKSFDNIYNNPILNDN